MCGRHGAGLYWPEEILREFQQQYPTYFCCNKDLSGAMLPIYYRTSFLTFWKILGLKEAFEKIIKYQTALKFEFQEHASDWPEDFHHRSYVCLFFLQQRFVQSYAANLLGDIFLNYLPSLSLG